MSEKVNVRNSFGFSKYRDVSGAHYGILLSIKCIDMNHIQ